MEDGDNAKIFPQRLMELLADEENRDAIKWLPHGKAFMIVNRQKFARDVLPRYFKKNTKWASFTRKLNRWNFARVSKGPELGAYYHEFFQRDNETLCTQMYCKNDRAKFAVAREASQKDAKKTDTGLSRNHQNLARSTSQVLPLTGRFPSSQLLLPESLSHSWTMSQAGNTVGLLVSAQARMLLGVSQGRHGNASQNDKTQAILDSAMLALKRSKELEVKASPLMDRAFVYTLGPHSRNDEKSSVKLSGHAYAA